MVATRAAGTTLKHHARPHFLVLKHQRHVRLLIDEEANALTAFVLQFKDVGFAFRRFGDSDERRRQPGAAGEPA